MPDHVIKCLKCGGHFPFSCENDYTGNVVCPECGDEIPFCQCDVLALCPNCRTKLSVPSELLMSGDLECPTCHQAFEYHGSSNISTSGSETTIAYTVKERPQEPKQMLKEGSFIDNYRVEKLLGAGGMAEVYLATHVLLNRECALKVMKPGVYTDDPVLAKRFVREAQLALKINHPNIVQVFDAGCDKATGLLFIAMEYVEGTNLSAYSKDRKVPESMLMHVAEEIAKALQAMNEQGIVHRDIKPANIMLCKDNTIKLMDLGIAKSSQPEGAAKEMTLTMEQSVLGTPAYASPEQCRAAHTADIRSDIYCLGASLYHIASGHAPYGGTTAVEILLKVLESTPEPLSTIRPDLSPFMISLVERMMEKEPEKRPQTPEELIEMLRQNDGEFAYKKPFPKKAMAIAAGIVVLLIAAIAAGFVMTRRPAPENPPPAATTIQPKQEEKQVAETPKQEEMPVEEKKQIEDTPQQAETTPAKAPEAQPEPLVQPPPVEQPPKTPSGNKPTAQQNPPQPPLQPQGGRPQRQPRPSSSPAIAKRPTIPSRLYTPSNALQEEMQFFILAQEIRQMRVDKKGFSGIKKAMKDIRSSDKYTNRNVQDFIAFLNSLVASLDKLNDEFCAHKKQLRTQKYNIGSRFYEIEVISKDTGVRLKELTQDKRRSLSWNEFYSFENCQLLMMWCKISTDIRKAGKANSSQYHPLMAALYFAYPSLRDSGILSAYGMPDEFSFSVLFPPKVVTSNFKKLETLPTVEKDSVLPKIVGHYARLAQAAKSNDYPQIKALCEKLTTDFRLKLSDSDIKNLQELETLVKE